MTQSNRAGGLEIDGDLEFQQRSWKVQRFGWIVMLLMVIAALLGLFGRGPLAHATAGTKGSALYLRYDRFTRLNAPHTLSVEVGAPAVAADSTTEIWLDRQWLAGNLIVQIAPHPERSANDGDRTIYTFRVAPGGRPSLVTFSLNSRAAGRSHGRIGSSNGSVHSFTQFTYP